MVRSRPLNRLSIPGVWVNRSHSSSLPLISSNSAISGSYPSISSPDPSCTLLQFQQKKSFCAQAFHTLSQHQEDPTLPMIWRLHCTDFKRCWNNRLYYFGASQSTYCFLIFNFFNFFSSRSSTVFTHVKMPGLCEDLRFGCLCPSRCMVWGLVGGGIISDKLWSRINRSWGSVRMIRSNLSKSGRSRAEQIQLRGAGSFVPVYDSILLGITDGLLRWWNKILRSSSSFPADVVWKVLRSIHVYSFNVMVTTLLF